MFPNFTSTARPDYQAMKYPSKNQNHINFKVTDNSQPTSIKCSSIISDLYTNSPSVAPNDKYNNDDVTTFVNTTPAPNQNVIVFLKCQETCKDNLCEHKILKCNRV